MIIWGWRGRTSVVESNTFHCPRCSAMRNGTLNQVRNFFTIYFIPLIPLNVTGRYVECGSCGGTFGEEVLTHDPEKEREETTQQLLRVMIMAALADGEVDDAERAEIRRQYQELAGLPVPPATLDDEIAMAISSGQNLNSFMRWVAPNLSPHGKALAVKLAFHTMSASEQWHPGHQEQLAKLGETLEIPTEQYRELISELSEPETEKLA